MSVRDIGYGPATALSVVTVTGAGSWFKPKGVLGQWGYSIATGGSTSTVTVKHKLEGTIEESTAPASGSVFTISTGSGAGHVAATNKVARQIRLNITTLSSTSSTGPTTTGLVAGTI